MSRPLEEVATKEGRVGGCIHNLPLYPMKRYYDKKGKKKERTMTAINDNDKSTPFCSILTADLRCIQFHVVDMPLDTPKIN